MTMQHMAGGLNVIADFTSRLLASFLEQQSFLTEFQTHFPISQSTSRTLCYLLNALIQQVLLMLPMPTSNLGSWEAQYKEVLLGTLAQLH